MKLRQNSYSLPLLLLSSILFLGLLDLTSAENILFLLPMGSKSHKNVFQPLITGMAARGHNVTVVSPYMPSKPEKGVTEMVPTDFASKMLAWGNDPIARRKEGNLASWIPNYDFAFTTCREVYQHPEFMALLDQKFDLVYINAFINDCFHGFIHKLGAPFIIVSTVAAPANVAIHAGNRLPPSFVPSLIFDYSDSMTFFQRINNLVFSLLIDTHLAWMYMPEMEVIYKEFLGQDLPGLYDLKKEVSAIFMNSHFTITYSRPTLPNILEVGGMHCRPSQPLPKDIEEFVSDAPNGVIYFSLGSIIQANTMPEEVRQTFLNVFSRLKQKVLWKWETGVMDNLPPNVKLLKWAPQQDILGHKNVKMFITHGGLLSTLEATYHGVPLIGIPFFGDQDLNMAKAERAGYAVALEILDMTEESLEKVVRKVLTEPSYTESAKELSSLFRDQAETPLERAIFWSEYIIRHKGAKHMQTAARNLNFFQYHSLDVVGVLLLIVFSILWLIKVIVCAVYRKLCGGGKNKGEKVKRN